MGDPVLRVTQYVGIWDQIKLLKFFSLNMKQSACNRHHGKDKDRIYCTV